MRNRQLYLGLIIPHLDVAVRVSCSTGTASWVLSLVRTSLAFAPCRLAGFVTCWLRPRSAGVRAILPVSSFALALGPGRLPGSGTCLLRLRSAGARAMLFVGRACIHVCGPHLQSCLSQKKYPVETPRAAAFGGFSLRAFFSPGPTLGGRS